jgi:UDP-glucuronate 4-epimerase
VARFLVTGAAGFIGRHLTRWLTASGHQVVAADRRPAPADLPGEVHEVDLFTCDLDPLLDGVEYVVHLAGQPGVRESWTQFADYSRGNIELTQRLLEALRGRPVRKFVLASTSSVYGTAPVPTREDGPVQPVSPYGATKLAAESLCDLYGRTAGVPWLALRYFTVYGPGQRPDMAFTRWLTAARDGTPVQIYGAGDQVRDFTYVGDAVAATEAAALSPAQAMAVNVGGGQPVPIKEALRLIEQVTGRPLRVVHLPAAAGDMAVTRADTERLAREVGVVPATPLAEGLARQFEWIAGGGKLP